MRALGKLNYVQGKDRPDVDCILCAIRDNDKRVVSLKVYQDNIIFIVLNLYPYNIGHLMVCLNRHVKNFTELTKQEIIHIFRTIQGLQLLLNDLYHPHGYNIGLNQGKEAGASINHIHWHIVPRFPSELGYIDIIGDARIVVEGLDSVKKKIEEKIGKYLNEKFFNNF
ncbi:MAG: HIT domain-containing protein [Promethearchaeota archaeon]